MKKRTSILILVALLCLGSILLTSCANDTSSSIVIGENGNWIINGNDTGVKAQGTDGSKVTVGENGNWFVDGVDTGIIAVPEKYVVDVKTEYTIDPVTGDELIVTTLLYNDGTTDTQKNIVYSRIMDVYLCDSTTSFIAGYEPYLHLYVCRENCYYDTCIPVTDDMWITPKPDFTKPGEYDVVLNYCGMIIDTNFNVIEAPENLTIVGAYLYDPFVKAGTPLSEIAVTIDFSNGYSYDVSLSTASFVSVSDLNKAGEYAIAYTFGEEDYYSSLYVFEIGTFNICNFDLYDLDTDTIELGNTVELENFKKDLIGKKFDYSPIYYANASDIRYGYVTESMVDMSALDITKPGVYPVKININDPLCGKYTYTIDITVDVDLSNQSPIKQYTTSNDYLYSCYGNSLDLYENGIALFGGYVCNYVKSGNLVTISGYPDCNYAKIYLTVNDTANTFDATLIDGTPKEVYTSNSPNYTFKVYNDYVSIYYQTSDSNAFIFATISKNIVDNTLLWNDCTYQFLSNGKYIVLW